MSTYSTNAVTYSAGRQLAKFKEGVKATAKTLEFRVMTIILTALMLWGAAIATFGYPALIIVALALVPMIFTCLLLITVGK